MTPQPNHRGTPSRLGAKLLLGLGAVSSTLLLDRALGWAGMPAEPPAFPVGPPHWEARVANPEYEYTRRTNDRGIRYRTIPLEKPPGVHRVVLVGDSFTEGACVEDEQRWSNLIEQGLAGHSGSTVELINCGEAGTHPVDYARTLVQLGMLYDPDAVIVGIYFDDVPNTPANLNAQLALAQPGPGGTLTRFVRACWPHFFALLTPAPSVENTRQRSREYDIVAKARRIAKQSNIDEQTFERWLAAVPDSAIQAINAGHMTPGLVTHALSQPDFFQVGIGLETEEARAKMDALGRLLSALNQLCRERQVRFGVVHMPSVHQFDPRSSETVMARVYGELGHPVREAWKEETTPVQRELAAWAEREGVPFLDLVPVFRAAVATSSVRLNFEIDPHWTPAGHAVAAQAIQGWMEASGLLPR